MRRAVLIITTKARALERLTHINVYAYLSKQGLRPYLNEELEASHIQCC